MELQKQIGLKFGRQQQELIKPASSVTMVTASVYGPSPTVMAVI